MGLQISGFLCYMTAFFSLTPSSTPTNLPSSSPTHQSDPAKVLQRKQRDTLSLQLSCECITPGSAGCPGSLELPPGVQSDSVLGWGVLSTGNSAFSFIQLMLYRSQTPPQPLNISCESWQPRHTKAPVNWEPCTFCCAAGLLWYTWICCSLWWVVLTCLTESLPCHSSDSGASCEWLWKEPCMQCNSCRLHLEPSQEDLSGTQQQKGT